VAFFASILVSFLVGLFLVFAPWTHLWDANSLLQPHSALRSVLLSTFTRGTVSGIGLINILLALNQAREYLNGHHGNTGSAENTENTDEP
jgi:hypothetical protein